MPGYGEQFKGKKITLMGLGLLGRGVGDAEFFAEAGADLIVTDLKSEAELAPSVERLKKFSNVTYHLGGHRMEDFEGRDLIIRAPNTPLDSPYIAHARESGIPIEMDASLFAKLSSVMTIGVTGTRGKSTVTHFIYEILKAAGQNTYLGGNERGVATLPLLHKTGAGDIVLLELDSWQLQGFEENTISPHIAVWTNFMPDHMNYYKNDMDRYFQDKAAIARFQKAEDFFITTKEIKEKIESRFGILSASCTLDPTLPDEWTLALPGDHNRKNAAYALAVARILGIPDGVSQKALESFSGLPGRMEFLGEKNGIVFYNDTNATTPEALIAALDSLTPKKRPIVLIAGGSDKELDLQSVAPKLMAGTKDLIFFKGAATEKLKALLPPSTSYKEVADMKEAFTAALSLAKPGDTVLLSPGATSFGIFKNEYDRGDQFREFFAKL